MRLFFLENPEREQRRARKAVFFGHFVKTLHECGLNPYCDGLLIAGVLACHGDFFLSSPLAGYGSIISGYMQSVKHFV